MSQLIDPDVESERITARQPTVDSELSVAGVALKPLDQRLVNAAGWLSFGFVHKLSHKWQKNFARLAKICLLYTSDAADE